MTRWLGAASALVASVLAIAAVELAWPPRPDFPPFVMTIEEWHAVRGTLPSGGAYGGTYIYRVEYRDRSNWTRTLVADIAPNAPTILIPQQGAACRNGEFGHIDIHGVFRVTSDDPLMCTTLDRWIHYGMAQHYPWKREIGDGVITLSDPGERVVFDAKTGLPRLYETGPRGGAPTYRVTYRVDRWRSWTADY